MILTTSLTHKLKWVPYLYLGKTHHITYFVLSLVLFDLSPDQNPHQRNQCFFYISLGLLIFIDVCCFDSLSKMLQYCNLSKLLFDNISNSICVRWINKIQYQLTITSIADYNEVGKSFGKGIFPKSFCFAGKVLFSKFSIVLC